jgi:spectinomycin phosphotransferase
MKVPLPHAEVAIQDVFRTEWQLSVAALHFIPIGDSAYCYDLHTAANERLFLKVVDLRLRKGRETAARMAFSLPVMEVVGRAHAQLQEVGVPCPRRTVQGQLSVTRDALLFALFPFVEGATLADAYPEPAALVERIGRAVAQIHQVVLPPDVARLASPDLLGADTFTEDLLADLESLRTLGRAADPFLRRLRALIWPQHELIRSFVERSEAYAARARDGGMRSAGQDAGANSHLMLCHGDLWGGNLIAGSGPSLTVLDWESACLAPPERDAYKYVGAPFQAFDVGYRAGLQQRGVGTYVGAKDGQEEQGARDATFTWNGDLLAVYAYRKQLRNLAQWLHNLLHERLDGEQRENDLNMIDEHCLSHWPGLEPPLDQTRAAISG